MVTSPISISALQQSYSLDSTLTSYRDQLDLNDEFLDNITAAYAENETLYDQDLFDPALDSMNPALGLMKNAANGAFSGGIPVDVSGGAVTLTQESTQESIRVEPYHNVTVEKVSDDALFVMNETTDRGLQIEMGQSLQVTGEGQAEIVSGDGQSLRLESGEAVTLTETNDSLKVKESTFRKEINFQDGETRLRAVGESGSDVTLFTGPSEEITFSEGQGGRIQRTSDGAVQITNLATEKSITVDSRETLKAQGEAEVVVGEDSAFRIEEGDKISVTSSDGTVQLRNKSIAGSVSLGQTPTFASDNPIQAATNPVTSQIRNYGGLLQQPASTISLSQAEEPTRKNGYGSIENVITPIGERETERLLDAELRIDSDQQSIFYAEQEVSEITEELPGIIDSSRSNDEFAIAEENQQAFAAFENQDTGFAIADSHEDEFAIADGSESEFAIAEDNSGSEFLDETV